MWCSWHTKVARLNCFYFMCVFWFIWPLPTAPETHNCDYTQDDPQTSVCWRDLSERVSKSTQRALTAQSRVPKIIKNEHRTGRSEGVPKNFVRSKRLKSGISNDVKEVSWHLSSVKNERMWLSYGMDRMCDGLSPGGRGQCGGSGSVESVSFPWIRIRIKKWLDPDPYQMIRIRIQPKPLKT